MPAAIRNAVILAAEGDPCNAAMIREVSQQALPAIQICPVSNGAQVIGFALGPEAAGRRPDLIFA